MIWMELMFDARYERLCISPLEAPVKMMTISFGSLIVTFRVGVAVKSGQIEIGRSALGSEVRHISHRVLHVADMISGIVNTLTSIFTKQSRGRDKQ